MATQFDMQEREWENHPEGVFVAQLANFVDEGEKEGRYGPYRSAYYLLQTGEVDSTGQVFPEMRYYVNDECVGEVEDDAVPQCRCWPDADAR